MRFATVARTKRNISAIKDVTADICQKEFVPLYGNQIYSFSINKNSTEVSGQSGPTLKVLLIVDAIFKAIIGSVLINYFIWPSFFQKEISFPKFVFFYFRIPQPLFTGNLEI